MSCSEIRELMVLEADGALEASQRDALALHLMSCRECRLEQARTEEEWASLRRMASRFRLPAAASDVDLQIRSLLPPHLGPNGSNGHARNGAAHHGNGHHANGHLNGHHPNGHRRNGHRQNGHGQSHQGLAVGPGASTAAAPRTAGAHIRLPQRRLAFLRGPRAWAALAIVTTLVLSGSAAWLLAHRARLEVRLVATAERSDVRLVSGGARLLAGDALPLGDLVGVSSAGTTEVRIGERGVVRLTGDATLRFSSAGFELVSGTLRVGSEGNLLLHVPGALVTPVSGWVELQISTARGSGPGDLGGEIHVVRGQIDLTPDRGDHSIHLGTDDRYPLGHGGDDRSGARQDGQDPSTSHGASDTNQSPPPKPADHGQTTDGEQSSDDHSGLAGSITTISVRDRATQLPIPDATIRFWGDLRQGGGFAPEDGAGAEPHVEARTDESGIAVVTGLNAGTYELTARGPEGYGGQAAQRIEIGGDGLTVVSLVLSPDLHLVGKLVDASGRAVGAVAVGDAVTDARGQFALELPAGVWRDLAVDASQPEAVRVRGLWSPDRYQAASGSAADRVAIVRLSSHDWWIVLRDATGASLEAEPGTPPEPQNQQSSGGINTRTRADAR